MQRWLKVGFFGSTAVLMILMVWFGMSTEIGLGRNPLPGSEFPRARVLEFLDGGTGMQTLLAEILTGEHRGRAVEVRNIIFIDAAVNPRVGQTMIIHFDYHGGGSYSAHVHSYARDFAIYIIAALFLALLVLTGGKSGVRSAYGLVFTFVTLLFFLIPAIMRGAPPAALTVFVAMAVTAVSLIAIMGFEKKTLVSIIGTMVGIGFYCLFYAVIAAALRVSGGNIPEMNQLVGLGFTDPVNLTQLLFCGILIASLGAIMDTSVSVASATAELSNAKLSFNELFKSSMRMARDCIGSSANTLILAFTGTFFVTLIMFQVLELNYTMLINRIDIAIEVLRAIAASAGMILSAPATALLGSYMYKGEPAKAG
ncbi:MAG: YibE/F family protein [Defluviitaleaceae bacterium]|nr:YibE/F family protein [Defluviitaleaceae bacterium]